MQLYYNIFALNRSETAERQMNLWQNQECTDMMRYAPMRSNWVNWVKKDGHSRGKHLYKCNQRLKRQEDAKHRFTDEQKEQAVKMCARG